jgi:hypothetical protein
VGDVRLRKVQGGFILADRHIRTISGIASMSGTRLWEEFKLPDWQLEHDTTLFRTGQNRFIRIEDNRTCARGSRQAKRRFFSISEYTA